ncbi:hypothetical protein FAM09_20910 [Niastella caeni]|uniref:Uncharacterized protein n=1 Tax=Niastella caeni TaxID=2569763 RepID=A0A4S8HKX4_9BACT|nr:hypothetical protein [Niastella caeni]THU35857.1 hypothetical protein FAM09_20910 [Niastella caeni]
MKHVAWCLLLLCQCALGQTSKEDDLNTISGNPYLFKEWHDGVVRFTSGRTVNQFKLKFDCLKNQLLLQFEGNAFAAESKVREFVMYPRKKDSLLFRRGFPTTDKTSESTYFHVLLQGKATLLRLIARNIVEEKQLVSVNGRINRRMEEVEYYYLLQNGTMTLLPANKNDLPSTFGDHKEQIAQLIAARQLKLHSPEDFVAVVKKYNELIAAQ